ncbi:MAG: TonB-dependent receptor [Deltaproteobacteria bacterium]|nr:TonB-dependent receptor [Deltaproteobacteria bacterium]
MVGVGRCGQFGAGLALVLGLTVPPASWAQAAKAKKPPTVPVEIEEITVTAQKREENIQEVPISVTALTGATLEQKGVKSVSDLGESVPNMYIVAAGYATTDTVLAMRGTSNNDTALSKNPTVGMYVDGFYIAKIIGNNLDLEDLERVEVLRGPQGTLFGRNTTGGAVNMVTRKPTEERSLTASTEVGNFDAFKGHATLNVPLIGKNGFWQSDAIGTLILRENVTYQSHDGYFRNQSPTNVPASGGSEFNTVNRISTMTAVRWQPIKPVTVDYTLEYHRYRQTPPYMAVTALFPQGDPNYNATVSPGGAFDLTPYVVKNRVDALGASAVLGNDMSLHRLADDGNHRMHILTGAWDLGEVGPLGNVTVKSISGYRAFTSNRSANIGNPLHVLDNPTKDSLDTWSEELQWVGTSSRIRYVLGAYYYGEHSAFTSQQVLFAGGVSQFGRTTTKNSAYAPFGQVTYTPPILSDKLSITAGLRYSEDHVHSNRDFRCYTIAVPLAPLGYTNACNLTPNTPIIGTNGQPIGLTVGQLPVGGGQTVYDLLLPYASNDFSRSVGKGFGGTDGLTPLGDITYQWTDSLMTYFRVSRGFQSGAVNDVVSDPRLIGVTDPEKLWSYEGGFKSQWFDNRLRVNADGFLSRYTDQVVPVERFSASTGLSTTNENAGKSEYWGSEVELAAIPVRGFEATVNYAFLSAKYLEWNTQKFVNGQPQFDANGKPVVENVANQRKVPYAPSHTVTVGLTYTAPPTTTGVFSAHLDTFWTHDFVGHPEPPYDDAQWAYAVVNGRLQFIEIPLQKGSLDVAVFGRNLFDRKYRTNGFSLGALGFAVDGYGDPRTFGLGLTYHFTAS